MKLFSSFRNLPTKENARTNAIIELIFSGNDMAAHLVIQDGRDFSCVCGMIVGPVENPSHHRNFCPIARFYAAVEALHAAQTPLDSSEVDRDFESLRNGAARYSTPREDAALFAVLGIVTAAIIGAIWLALHFAQKAGLPW